MGDQVSIYDGAILTAEQRQMADTIIARAQRAGINPAFMLALAVTESSLRPTITGDDGVSIGLFQLQLATARQFMPDTRAIDLENPDLNAQLAMKYMNRLNLNWPAHTYADYAEAWALGGHGRFELGRRNPNKVASFIRAIADLKLNLNPHEVWE